MTLRELGEDRLLQRLLVDLPRNRAVVSGPGDDCAIVEMPGAKKFILLKTDCVVEGIHFTSAAKPAEIGWKAMARPLSDFAAMAGLPEFALITLIAPSVTKVAWTTGVYRGLKNAARMFKVAIVGGETSRTSGAAAISVSLVGSVEKNRRVARDGARPGDELFVTGLLGGSIAGKHLRFLPRIGEARWLTSHFRIHAMMDLSDGLGADLPRLARASNLGFEVDLDAIPRTPGCSVEQAIADGEDYELLFALSPNESTKLPAEWRKKFPKVPLTRIGRFDQRSKIKRQKFPRGYVHFR